MSAQLESATGRLRCLWLARAMPVPLDAGDRIYTARLVEALADAGAEVTFMGLQTTDGPPFREGDLSGSVDWSVVPGSPRAMVPSLLSPRPLVAARYGTASYADELRHVLATGSFDAIVLDQYALVWALPVIDDCLKGTRRPLIAHVAHDFETEVTAAIAKDYKGNPVRKAALYLNALKTAAAERRIVSASDLVVTLTDRDAKAFGALPGAAASLVVPPGYNGPRVDARTITADVPRRVAILGSYVWIAKQMNLAGFLEVADPIFHEAGIGLDVVGNGPAEFREHWQGRVKATTFHGFVDDLSDFMAGRRMGLVVEATGGGFKLKVLDYVFMRAPVGAIADGIKGQDERLQASFLIRETATELARGVVGLIDNLDALNDMQRSAYLVADTRYEWSANGERLRDALMRDAPMLDD